jgi:hypothetical protein
MRMNRVVLGRRPRGETAAEEEASGDEEMADVQEEEAAGLARNVGMSET